MKPQTKSLPSLNGELPFINVRGIAKDLARLREPNRKWGRGRIVPNKKASEL